MVNYLHIIHVLILHQLLKEIFMAVYRNIFFMKLELIFFFSFLDDDNAGEDNPECQTRERIKMMGEDLIGLKTKRMKKPKSKK